MPLTGRFPNNQMAYHKGGFAVAPWVYFCPYTANKIWRVRSSTWPSTANSDFEVIELDNDLVSFWGCFTDGAYGYAASSAGGQPDAYEHPYGSGRAGALVRFSLADFSTSGVTVLQMNTEDANLAYFAGGAIQDAYGYLIPQGKYASNGVSDYMPKLARFSLSDFTATGISAVALSSHPSITTNDRFYGCAVHGNYIYMAPTNHQNFVRVKISGSGNIFNTAAIEVLDLTSAGGSLESQDGFLGVFGAGGHVYVLPGWMHGNVVKVDVSGEAMSLTAVLDVQAPPPPPPAPQYCCGSCGYRVSFTGGLTDGAFGYLIP